MVGSSVAEEASVPFKNKGKGCIGWPLVVLQGYSNIVDSLILLLHMDA